MKKKPLNYVARAKRTHITLDEEMSARERHGFCGVECYGSISPEPSEIGGIFRSIGHPQLDEASGLWVCRVLCVERIFLTARGLTI